MPAIKRFPNPIPYGWFFVGYCDELHIGEVRPLHYFGRELVLFRGEDGTAGMLDAHCPHLGAHLGYGGVVKGNSIACPFHGWEYDSAGWCTRIPYAKKIPPIVKRQAIIHSYPLTEANGVIWAWYHPHNVEPIFEVEVYPEFTDPDWVDQIRHEWRSGINPQDVAENGIDTAHFVTVHGTPNVPDGSSTYDGHRRVTWSEDTFDIVNEDGEDETIVFKVRTVMNGAGQKITLQESTGKVALMVLVTPIEDDDAEVRFCITYKKSEPGSRQEARDKGSAEQLVGPTAVQADLPIWNHKIHRENPLLVDGDGDILRFRRYFAQFYDFDTEPQAIAAE